MQIVALIFLFLLGSKKIQCEILWVFAVVVEVAVVVVEVVVVVVKVEVVVVIVAVVVPAIWHRPSVACNVSTAAGQDRADLIRSEANSPGRRGLIGY